MASSKSCVSIILPCVVLLAGLMVSAEARIALPTSDYNTVDGSSSNSGFEARSGQSAGADSVSAENADEVSGSSAMPWALGAIRVMRKVYLECQDEELTSCLKVQFIRAMDKVAVNIKEVPLMAGMSLERDPEFNAQEKTLSKDELEATLPRSLPDRERSLDKLIMDRVVSFFKNYSLRFKLPAMTDVSTGEEGEEARRRRQPPMNGMVGLLALLAGSLLPMKFGMLAMLAGKALMLSKLALIISALMAMRNMGNNSASSGAAVH